MEERSIVITVSRQMGSGGTYIGHEVAKELGLSYVDREILRQAARLLKEDEASLEAYEETSTGFMERFLRMFSLGSPENSYVPKEPPIYDTNLFVIEGRIIREMANRGNAVIMGRGGFSVLKGRPETLHLFIHAPRNYRVERVMKARGIADVKEAQAMIEESDRRRTKFVKDMVGLEWTNAKNYHLCIDSSAVDPAQSVSTIVQFAKAALL